MAPCLRGKIGFLGQNDAKTHGIDGIAAYSPMMSCRWLKTHLAFSNVQFKEHFVGNHMGVSKNRGKPPKLSIFIGFSMINHPFCIFGNIHMKDFTWICLV